MNRCKTCKFWEPAKSPFAITGTCVRVPHFWDATEWATDGSGLRLTAEHAHDLAFTQDSSDYMADLLTMPDFGCVQYEREGGN